MHTQAAVFRKPGAPCTLEDIRLDEPRDSEIIVRMVGCGICHSDIAVRDGVFASHFPCVLGHEGAGIVERIGKKVHTLRPGDSVVLSFNSCGNCPNCKKNQPSRCSHFDACNFGWARDDGSPTMFDMKGTPLGGNFFGQSSFAFHALAHERNAVKVTATKNELATYSPLGCGIQAGAGTVLHELQPRSNQSIVVLGVGSVGLAAVMASHLSQVKTIIAIDTFPSRLKLSKRLGAHFVVNGKKENIVTCLRSIVGNVDHIVDTTGNVDVINQAVSCLHPRGKISLLAIMAESNNPLFTPGSHQTVIDSIAGDSNPQEFIPRMIQLYKEGLFPFDSLIKFYPIEKINEAIEDSIRGITIKPVLRF